MAMNFNQLAVFHAIAESGSVSAAAARLYVSQPAVSKHLKELEGALDTQLFDRLPRGMRLTQSGEVLRGYAQQIFALSEEAQTALCDLKGLRRGRLAIGASTTIGNYLLPAAMAVFRRRFPEIRLSLQIENTEAIQDSLTGRQLDLGFVEGPAWEGDVLTEPFYHDELVVIAPPGHWSIRGGGLSLRNLAGESWVMREPGSGTREVVEQALAREGVRLPEGLWLGGTEAIKSAVARGAGLAIVSRLAVEKEVSVGILAVSPAQGFPIRRPLYRLGLRDRTPSAAATAMLGIMDELFPRAGSSAE